MPEPCRLLLPKVNSLTSVGYYAPQTFQSIRYTGTTNSLLASGIYGIIKVIATTLFVFFLVESLGRRLSLIISSFGMGTLFFIIGAILKTHPPLTDPNVAPPPASKAMAAMLYIYVCFYSMGWGPLPWVYVSNICVTLVLLLPTPCNGYGVQFVVSKVTPSMITKIGFKIFLMFGTVNIGAMGLFSLFIPETKGRSLEDMDVIFGAITAKEHAAHIAEHKRAHDHTKNDTRSSHLDTEKV
ncbi:hypothetical protein H0H87_003246 [Tephrocybe sp. NHM501043]|nr:hypothetical protein H0H87_003246 [Tephrocybe sp. NHM501043]